MAKSELCLACSSSLPPVRSKPSPNASFNSPSPPPYTSPSFSEETVYITPCCALPICPRCVKANPRLTRYNPCLSCLGGVDVVKAHRSTRGAQGGAGDEMEGGKEGGLVINGERNGDGGVRDGDVWVVGDEEDDDDKPVNGEELAEGEAIEKTENGRKEDSEPQPQSEEFEESATKQVPQGGVYYIQKGDTLHGLALRFGVSGRQICLLNSLPPSTLTTTPHLLHTRHTIKLPPSDKTMNLPPPPSLMTPEQAERMERERASKRLQMVTKEVDWRVAKAYVAVAELDDGEKKEAVSKEYGGDGGEGSKGPGGSAVERYLDDDEWEAAERKAGRGVGIAKFPYGGGFGKES